MRYAQAIQGNFQLALDYANALIADQSSKYHLLHRQERAVVLRLLGRHGEALKEFDDLLLEPPGFDYECQIERSCVKYQMGDKDGALEDARHAEHMGPARCGQFFLVLLSFHAIPAEFREWISKVCNTSQLHNRLLVPALCSSSYISTGDGEQDEDTALLEQALAMSMTGIPSAESGGDDQDLAHGWTSLKSWKVLRLFAKCKVVFSILFSLTGNGRN